MKKPTKTVTHHHRSHTRMPEVYEASAEAKKAQEVARRQLTADYRKTFNSESGVRVMRDLAVLTGQNQTNVSGNVVDRTIDPIGTLHNEAMRKVYLHIRQFLPPQTLAKVENENA